MTQPFRVSTGLKDLIGQGLITNDYVAVFELVKNSFDAHARSVRVLFLTDTIIIADDGKGMASDDITQKWLFVAYSAKSDGTEDLDYRHEIGQRRRHAYAGAKGVGRFSCDRLGKTLTLHSRAKNEPVQVLDVNWTLYEEDAKREFGDNPGLPQHLQDSANVPVLVLNRAVRTIDLGLQFLIVLGLDVALPINVSHEHFEIVVNDQRVLFGCPRPSSHTAQTSSKWRTEHRPTSSTPRAGPR